MISTPSGKKDPDAKMSPGELKRHCLARQSHKDQEVQQQQQQLSLPPSQYRRFSISSAIQSETNNRASGASSDNHGFVNTDTAPVAVNDISPSSNGGGQVGHGCYSAPSEDQSASRITGGCQMARPTVSSTGLIPTPNGVAAAATALTAEIGGPPPYGHHVAAPGQGSASLGIHQAHSQGAVSAIHLDNVSSDTYELLRRILHQLELEQGRHQQYFAGLVQTLEESHQTSIQALVQVTQETSLTIRNEMAQQSAISQTRVDVLNKMINILVSP